MKESFLSWLELEVQEEIENPSENGYEFLVDYIETGITEEKITEKEADEYIAALDKGETYEDGLLCLLAILNE